MNPKLTREVSISIHALREEGDDTTESRRKGWKTFLSTPSARRATRIRQQHGRASRNFYPRPPRGGRPLLRLHCSGLPLFLSTPSARRATMQDFLSSLADLFLSTPSARRATLSQLFSPVLLELFLSTPSARRATMSREGKNKNDYISIHALREEGDLVVLHVHADGQLISIHALREEGDVASPTTHTPPRDFYPRPPRGGRRKMPKKLGAA